MSVLKLQPQKQLNLRQAMPVQRSRPTLVVMSTVSIGMVIITLLALMLNIATSSGVYQIAGLKHEKKNLTESVQILSAQVDSLASAQNLSGAAQKLGMVANANPVFLDVTKKKIYGKPMAAIKSSQGRITKNLVPNHQMTTKTVLSELDAPVTSDLAETSASTLKNQASVRSGNVATDSTATQRVISSGDKLPGSPTN